jgi:hypothetical protein
VTYAIIALERGENVMYVPILRRRNTIRDDDGQGWKSDQTSSFSLTGLLSEQRTFLRFR